MLRSLRRAGAGLLVIIAATVALAGYSADAPSPPQSAVPVVVQFGQVQFAVQSVGWELPASNLVAPTDSDDPNLGPGEDADVADADLLVDLSGFQPVADEAVRLETVGKPFDVNDFVPSLAAPPYAGRSPPSR
jgi:zinc transport system substrate-binding protein